MDVEEFLSKYDLSMITELEEQDVHIKIESEEYGGGRQHLFAVDFKKLDKHTYWYNDTGDFGNHERCIRCALALAFFFLEEPTRFKALDSRYSTDEVAREKYIEFDEFLKSLYV